MLSESTKLQIISTELTTIVVLILVLFFSILFRPTKTLDSEEVKLVTSVSASNSDLLDRAKELKTKDVSEQDIEYIHDSNTATLDLEQVNNAAIICSTGRFESFLQSSMFYNSKATLAGYRSTDTATIYTFLVADSDAAFDVTVDILGGTNYSVLYNILDRSYPVVRFAYGRPDNREDIYKAMKDQNLTESYSVVCYDDSDNFEVYEPNTSKLIQKIEL